MNRTLSTFILGQELSFFLCLPQHLSVRIPMRGLGNAILKAQLRTCESVHVIRGLRRPASAPPASHLARLFLGTGRQPAGPLFRSVRDATLLLPRQLRTRRSSALVIFPQLCPCLDPSCPLQSPSLTTDLGEKLRSNLSSPVLTTSGFWHGGENALCSPLPVGAQVACVSQHSLH